MKKSLLIWGALIVIALCFVGCCYYTTNHNCCKHKHWSEKMDKKCPSGNTADDTVETMTIEAVEIVPVTGPVKTPAGSKNDAGKAAKPAPAAQPASAADNASGK